MFSPLKLSEVPIIWSRGLVNLLKQCVREELQQQKGKSSKMDPSLQGPQKRVGAPVQKSWDPAFHQESLPCSKPSQLWLSRWGGAGLRAEKGLGGWGTIELATGTWRKVHMSLLTQFAPGPLLDHWVLVLSTSLASSCYSATNFRGPLGDETGTGIPYWQSACLEPLLPLPGCCHSSFVLAVSRLYQTFSAVQFLGWTSFSS